MATIKGIKAGQTTITASYGGLTSNGVVFTVNAINATLTFSAVGGTLYYNGSAQKIGTITYTGDSSNVYYLVKTNSTTPTASDSGWTKITTWTSVNGITKTLDVNSSAANVATYYVFLKADAGTNYNAVSVKSGGNKPIAQRQVTITAPTVVSGNLIYNGSEKPLTTGGTSVDKNNTGTTVGTMYYYASTSSNTPEFSTSTWTTSAAKATNAGVYNIWYYCYVSDTANNTTATSGSATSINTVTKLSSTKEIQKATGSGSVSMTGWVYGGTVTDPTATTSTNGSVSYTWYNSSKTQLSNKPASTSAVGTYYVKGTFAATGNYNAYTTDYVSFTITQREVGLTWGAVSWVYDGTAHGTTCTATNLVSGDSCTVTLSNNSITTVAQSPVTVTATALSNSNYKLPSSKTKNISITARPIKITAANGSKQYDGTALTNNTATAEAYNSSGNRGLANGESMTSCTVTGSQTNVGSSSNVPSGAIIKNGSNATTTSNYNIEYINGTLTVSAGTLTVTATAYNAVYDGNSHPGITAISAKNQNGDVVSPTFTYSTSQTGTYTSSIPEVKNVTTGTAIWYKATLSGYDPVNSSVNAIVTAKVATLTFANLTHTYDGASHSATCSVSNLASGDTCSVTLSNASRTAQGTQTVTATALSNSNYALPTATASKTATLTINKRPIKITAATDSKQYDGIALTNNNYTVEANSSGRGIVTGQQVTACTVTGSQTDVGSSNNVPSGVTIKSGSTDVTSNYNIQYVNGTLTITVRTVTITAPGWISGTVTYGPTTAAATEQTLATGGSCTAGGTMYYYISTSNSTPTFNASTWSTSSDIKAKNAGTYYVWYYCSVTDTTNNTGTGINTVTKLSNSKAIDQRQVTLNWGTTSWPYDGSTHSTTCSAGNLCSGDTCNVTLTGNSVGKNVGSVTVTASSLSNSNYKLPSSKTKSISITAKVVTLTWGTLTWPYDSTAHSTTCVVNNKVSGDTCTVTLTGNSVGPDVGTSTVTATGLSNSNYTLTNTTSETSQTLSITTITATLTFTKAGTLTYNGAAQVIGTVSYNGDGDVYYIMQKATSQPSTPAANASNWVALPSNGQITATEAGTYYVFLKATAGTNYVKVDPKDGGNHTINKKSVTITGASQSRAYNGSALTNNNVTPSGLVSGHSIASYDIVGSQTYVGSSNNTPSNAVIQDGSGNAVTSNYNITYSNGTLTITKATPVVSISGVDETYTGGQFWAKATVNAKGTLYWKRGSAPTTSSNDGNVPITAINTATNITSVVNDADDFEMYWLFVPSSTANSLSSGHTYAENFTNAGGGSGDHKSLTINPRNISNVTASAAAVTYNGANQTANITITDSGATLTANDYTFSGNTQKNANTYTITITGQNNYTGTKEITWTINKRNVTITADSASKTYDGTALTKNSVTASAQNNTNNTGMISSHHVHTWTVSGSQTLAGSSSNTVSAATIYEGATHGGSGDSTNVTSNYNITYSPGTLTVNAMAITATAKSHTKAYDGTKLSATNEGSVSPALPTGHTITYSCSGEVGPAVTSNGVATLNSVVIKNAGGTNVTSSFTVTKVNGTLKITNGTITYSTSANVSAYCTDEPMAIAIVDVDKTIEIASSAATDATGVSTGITYSTNRSGWTNNGTTLIVPANTAAGTYNITVSAAKANHTTTTNNMTVTIIETELTSLNLTLNATSVNYGNETTVKTLIAGYNNGKTIDVKDDPDTTYSQSPAGIVQFL